MRWWPSLILVLPLIAIPGAAEASYLALGTDPAGDNHLSQGQGGGTVQVTDILGAHVATDAGELLFMFDLAGTSEPIGSFCWAVGFEADGNEMFPVICTEFAAGSQADELGWTDDRGSVRGQQVPESYGEFVDGGIVVHIPLAAAGLATGERITDIYMLTYNTRGLFVADVMPDAKSTSDAEENLGSYTIGSGAAPVADDTEFRALTGPTATAEDSFATPTNKSIQYNWTTTFTTGTFSLETTVAAGTVDVRVLDGRNATVYNATSDESGTDTVPVSGNAGVWSIQVTLRGFQGEYSFGFGEEATTTTTTTTRPTTTPTEEPPTTTTNPSPAFGVIVALAAIAVALVRRRL